MGEISLNCGQIYISGKLSYASQMPWIFSGSIKENILFGQEYEDNRYRKTLDVCALRSELDQMEDGDETRVNVESSVNMSRSLKSRINLAR